MRDPKFERMDSVAISRALVASAFAIRDYNGGIDDTCHAANCLHKLIDEEGCRRNSEYSPEQACEYLRKVGRL